MFGEVFLLRTYLCNVCCVLEVHPYVNSYLEWASALCMV